MIGSLGGPELILILVIALIVFGPRKLPDIGKSIGKMMVEFRKASADFKRTVEDEVEAERRRPAPRIAAPAAAAPAAAAPASSTGPDAATADAPAEEPTPRAPEEGTPEPRRSESKAPDPSEDPGEPAPSETS